MYHIYIKCYNWANLEVQVAMPLQLTYETRIKNNTIETNFSKTEIVVKNHCYCTRNYRMWFARRINRKWLV